MTVDYTFAPILLDASPIPSRFVAPLDSPTGGVWLESRPVASVPVSWDRGQSIMAIVIGGHLVYVGPPRDLDLALRPRRRGQRPTGTPRSVWWRMSRSERRRLVSDPAFASLPVVKPAPVGVWNNGLAVAEVGP